MTCVRKDWDKAVTEAMTARNCSMHLLKSILVSVKTKDRGQFEVGRAYALYYKKINKIGRRPNCQCDDCIHNGVMELLEGER